MTDLVVVLWVLQVAEVLDVLAPDLLGVEATRRLLHCVLQITAHTHTHTFIHEPIRSAIYRPWLCCLTYSLMMFVFCRKRPMEMARSSMLDMLSPIRAEW